MEKRTLAARLDPELWDLLHSLPGANDTERLRHALGQLKPTENPSEVSTPVQEPPNEVEGQPDEPEDALDLLAWESIADLRLNIPPREAASFIRANLVIGEAGPMIDLRDGEPPVPLDAESVYEVFKADLLTAGHSGSGSGSPREARVPTRREPDQFGGLVRYGGDEGTFKVNMDAYDRMTPSQKLDFQKGTVR
jgi:hypothetical protein